MTATTVNGQLLSPLVALPAGSVQVTLTLVDYDDAPVVGFNTIDSTEVLSTVTIVPTTGGLWTAQLVPNADIQLFNGLAQTAYRVTETGNGAVYTYWIVVTASVNPVWVGSLRTTLVGTTGGSAAAMAIAGGLTVGGAAVFDGTVTAAQDPTLPLQLATKQYVDAHGSSQPYQFRPESYGAFGDNVHDDTTAFRNMLIAGWNYLSTHNGYVEYVLQPVTYLIAGAPITGALFNGVMFNGSAQLPLQAQAETAEHVVIAWRCSEDQTELYHWHQTTAQRSGAILRSTWAAGASLPATGEASVVGGPTPHFMGDPPSSWSNVHVVWDGVSIEVPTNPQICGIDLRCIGSADVKNGAALALSAGTGAPQIPDPNWAFGLAMPIAGNNDECNVENFSCEGFVIGLEIFEHAHGDNVRLVNCYDGLVCFSSSGFPHGNEFDYVSIENCVQLVVLNGGFNKLDITLLDVEWGTGAIIKDAGTTPAEGRIGIRSNGGDGTSLSSALSTGATAVTVVNGGVALEIVNLDEKRGAVTAPAVPATTVAMANPFWRDAEVIVAGGTVTEIAVDGVNQLITSGTVTVPTGKTIALTYSVAPSWVWKLL